MNRISKTTKPHLHSQTQTQIPAVTSQPHSLVQLAVLTSLLHGASSHPFCTGLGGCYTAISPQCKDLRSLPSSAWPTARPVFGTVSSVLLCSHLLLLPP